MMATGSECLADCELSYGTSYSLFEPSYVIMEPSTMIPLVPTSFVYIYVCLSVVCIILVCFLH